jgi:myo-inositol-1(or 4)-monophosphatase
LLVTEAGGLIGNFTGEANYLEQKECLAANPKVYAQMVSLLGKYSKFASAGEKAAARQAGTLKAASATPEQAPDEEAPL